LPTLPAGLAAADAPICRGDASARHPEESLNVSHRSGLRTDVVLAATIAAVLLGQASATHAQGRLDARYTASLAGIPIGRGAWAIEIDDDKYVAAASGATAGLMRLFSGGEGTGASRGRIVNGQFLPGSYAASILTSSRKSQVRLGLKGGAVRELDVSPPIEPDSERVPIRESHRRGVIDPMTASLLRVDGNPLVPAACQRTVSVFDGRMRYDLRLAYKTMQQVKADKGYAGPALVCSVYFQPIAGHIPSRATIKYLAELRDMELRLVPIAGTSVLVPFRVSIPTPFGLGVLEATQFLTGAQRRRAATSGATAE
jgi:hypothetical protein